MNHAANCKFCKREMVVQVDDGYAPLGDPYKLMRLAACNRCADLRTRRHSLEQSIQTVCRTIAYCTAKGRDAAIARAKPMLDALTRKYCVLVADWHNMSGYLWDEAFPAMLIEKPERFGDILHGYWKTFRQSQNLTK